MRDANFRVFAKTFVRVLYLTSVLQGKFRHGPSSPTLSYFVDLTMVTISFAELPAPALWNWATHT